MNDQVDILSFQRDYWRESLWLSRHQIMSRLARRHKVLFACPRLYWLDGLRNLWRKNGIKTGVEKVTESLCAYVPELYFSQQYRFPTVDEFAKAQLIKRIKRILEKLEFGELVLYLWTPDYLDMVGQFGAKLVCYHIVDEYAGYHYRFQEDRERIRELEDQLLKRADLVFTGGKELLKRKNKYDNAVLVPNGVDYDLFSKAVSGAVEIPEDMKKIPKPRIGYVGNITNKVDFELLAHIALARPNWSIVLVGPINVRGGEVRQNLSKLKDLDNVSLLGRKPRDRMPHYIKGLDVCMMCYRSDEWIYYGSPLKMHEYLACGKPVVSVGLPAVREFSQVIRIAHTVDGWIQHIEESLAEADPDLVNKRMSVAEENTWDSRVDLIWSLISDKLKQKDSGQR